MKSLVLQNFGSSFQISSYSTYHTKGSNPILIAQVSFSNLSLFKNLTEAFKHKFLWTPNRILSRLYNVWRIRVK